MKEESFLDRVGISGSSLKIFAVICMLIDSVGAVILENGPLRDISAEVAVESKLFIADLLCRMVGRMAFPIFAFLLVEGFLHTKDVKAYAKRLGIFALISEIPFDLACYGTPFYPWHQNVFFTLLVGLFILMAVRNYKTNMLIKLFCMVSGCMTVILLRSDYGALGIILMVLFYILHNRKIMQTVLGCFLLLQDAMSMIAFQAAMSPFATSLLAFVPIRLYNGTKGRDWKYVFYWIYPAHLMLFFLIRVVAFGM